MLAQAIDSIDEAALQALIDNQVAERRDLEFKRDLPGNSDEEKKEFLADVTALANAQGGDLIFGIEEINGVAGRLDGVELADVDGQVLRLENILRTGVEPRLIGTKLKVVALVNGSSALIIRVPGSLAAPHRVGFKSSNRFFTRNSRGKYEMDVHELRQAFTQSEGLSQRFVKLHQDAVRAAQGEGMPFATIGRPTAVVSMIPLGLFREERDLPLTSEDAVVPYDPYGIKPITMIEGIMQYSPADAGTDVIATQALTHRSGRVDAAWFIGAPFENAQGATELLAHSVKFEGGLRAIATSARARLGKFGIEGPWALLASVYGTMDAAIPINNRYLSSKAYRDEAFLGDLLIEEVSDEALLPLAGRFWRLFGKERPADLAFGT